MHREHFLQMRNVRFLQLLWTKSSPPPPLASSLLIYRSVVPLFLDGGTLDSLFLFVYSVFSSVTAMLHEPRHCAWISVAPFWGRKCLKTFSEPMFC